jgi:hypothetical protein
MVSTRQCVESIVGSIVGSPRERASSHIDSREALPSPIYRRSMLQLPLVNVRLLALLRAWGPVSLE